MALQDTGGGPSPSVISAAQQQAQAGPSGGGGAQARRLQERDLSYGGQRLLDLQRSVEELIEGKYKDPEEAHNRLSRLDEAGQERLRNNPEEIGELRQGVDPKSVDSERLAEFSHVFEGVKPEVRQEVAGHEQGIEQYEAREREQQEAAMAKSPEARANESLSGAMSISHHASI